jgi:hypothetical protein
LPLTVVVAPAVAQAAPAFAGALLEIAANEPGVKMVERESARIVAAIKRVPDLFLVMG